MDLMVSKVQWDTFSTYMTDDLDSISMSEGSSSISTESSSVLTTISATISSSSGTRVGAWRLFVSANDRWDTGFLDVARLPRRTDVVDVSFLGAGPGRDDDDDNDEEVGGAEETPPLDVEVFARPRARVGLFPMPLFCPDRAFRECAPIMIPKRLATLDRSGNTS